MTEFVLGVIAALFGAVFGAGAEHWRANREKDAERKERLVQRYLIQFQDAVEALWHRLHNLANRGGRLVMTDRYFEITTLDAVGRALALERIVALEGVLPQIATLDRTLARHLRDQPLSRKFAGLGLYQYDQISLAESLIERENGQFRTSTFLEFRRRYESADGPERDWLTPAREAIANLGDPGATGTESTIGAGETRVHQLLDWLRSDAERLADVTKLRSSIGDIVPDEANASARGAKPASATRVSS